MSPTLPLTITTIVALALAASREPEKKEPAPPAPPTPPTPPTPPGPEPLPPIPPNPTPEDLARLAGEIIRRAQAGEFVSPERIEELAQKMLLLDPALAATLYALAAEMRKREAPIDIGAGTKIPPALGARVAFLLSPSSQGKTRALVDATLAELDKLGPGFARLKTALERVKIGLPA